MQNEDKEFDPHSHVHILMAAYMRMAERFYDRPLQLVPRILDQAG